MNTSYMDEEEKFGFHSEYYIDFDWKWREEFGSGPDYIRRCCKGYMKFSLYKNKIYTWDRERQLIYRFDPVAKETEVIQIPINKETEVSFHSTGSYYSYDSCIAVNKHGYFLYDTERVTLFDFDGKELYSYKYGSKANEHWKECVYIYDSKFYYSSTKTTSSIMYVDMITKEAKTVWSMQKGDETADSHLKQEYQREHGLEYPYNSLITNMGNLTCKFLYVNEKRIVAGYQRVKGFDYVSYIVNLDLEKRVRTFLECDGKFDRRSEYNKYPKRQIFSFDMLADKMWTAFVESEDYHGAVNLFSGHIRNLSGILSGFGESPTLEILTDSPATYHAYGWYFDGKYWFIPENIELYRIKDGEKIRIDSHDYQTGDFYALGNFYFIPNEFEDYIFKSITGKDYYEIKQRDLKVIVENAKPQQETQEELTASFGDSYDSHPVTEAPATENSANGSITLQGFRMEAPLKEGFRDELLAYRKSLSNSWDYNAYVGILLGVRGPKHGDAACMNFAIGQGDNGNNTKKTLENRGLMPIFEKYKGKKVESSIMLSDIEAEIIAIAPEYEEIKRKFHQIIGF